MNALLDRLARALPGVDCGDAVVERLAGLTNETWAVRAGGEHLVVRVPGAGTERYVDREAELHNVRVAAAIGVAPEVLHVDADGLQIARFVDGRALSPADFTDGAVLESAVDLLVRLHRCDRPFRGTLSPYTKLDQYLRLAAGRAADGRLAALRRRAEAVRPLVEDGARACPCHADLNPSNFLETPERLWLIDWEYAARCDPTWDLACLAAEAGFDRDARARLLVAYHGATSPEREDRLAAYEGVLHLLAAAWAVVQGMRVGPVSDYGTMASDRSARAAALLPPGD